MNVTLKLLQPPFEESQIAALHAASKLVFGAMDPDQISWRLSQMPDATVILASEGTEPVGFKAGYAITEAKYYSWIGGVLPERRRAGIAAEMMELQHDWLSGRGYSVVETATRQDNRAMAAVNLKHGFEIAGLRRNRDNTQILFLKYLAGEPINE